MSHPRKNFFFMIAKDFCENFYQFSHTPTVRGIEIPEIQPDFGRNFLFPGIYSAFFVILIFFHFLRQIEKNTN
jgi:hypothetical protein